MPAITCHRAAVAVIMRYGHFFGLSGNSDHFLNAEFQKLLGFLEDIAIVGNITYYFPTKDDLVNRLAMDLSALNSHLMSEDTQLSIYAFLKQYKNVFENQIRYRCLLLSVVHLMDQNKVLYEQYKQIEQRRYATIVAHLSSLQQLGYLKPEIEASFLVSVLMLVGRFWISEANVSFRHLTPQEQIAHYSALLAKLLIPYTTPKGYSDVEQFLSGL